MKLHSFKKYLLSTYWVVTKYYPRLCGYVKEENKQKFLSLEFLSSEGRLAVNIIRNLYVNKYYEKELKEV